MTKLLRAGAVLLVFVVTILLTISIFNRTPQPATILGVVSSVSDVLSGRAIRDPSVSLAAFRTFSRITLCVLLSAGFGSLYGIILFVSRNAREATSALNLFVRAIPITFLYGPMVLVANPLGYMVPVWLASIPCVFIIAESIATHAEGLSEDRIASMKSILGPNKKTLCIHFYFWEAFLGLLTGLRIAIPYGGILVGVLEFIGAGNNYPGFGMIVSEYRMGGDSNELMLAIVLLYALTTTFVVMGVSTLIRRIVSSRLG